MSCNHCTTKFNFFHKEVGCANCGLSFCNKCLKQKCRIPQRGTVEYNVCRTCFQKLTSSSTSSSGITVITPPEAYLKRLEALDNSTGPPPITIYKNDAKRQETRSGMTPQDVQIMERLEKLKHEGKWPPPSENEIRQRLAKLKGENNYVVGPSKQTSDTLLEKFIVEREIELVQNPQQEIEARLASLREQGTRPNEGTFIRNLHDSESSSEDEVEKITKKIMDEVALDNRCPVKLSSDEVDEDTGNREDSPELPWCVMCNNDAQYRCLDCNGDLYCSECNVEAHHKVIPYSARK